MKHLFLLLVFVTSISFSQTFNIKGKVKNSSTGESIPFATIKVKELSRGGSSDLSGGYSLSVLKGSYTLEVSCFGFQTTTITLNVESDMKYDFKLSEDVKELQEVVITMEEPDANVSKVEMSVEKLDIEEIKKMPAFLGEVDVIRSLQLLPGVTTVGEGATGFNVRGGNIDQNLVLLDRAPVYSSSHLFGFFSIFNSDAVSDLTLYKGGIPARYGGRLSSVLEINQAEGNSERISAKGGIGVVSSRLTIGGPIGKKKRGTWLVSGRRSYVDLFLRLSSDESISENISYFYDLNGQGSYKLNDNNRLYLSGYYGRDVFKFGDDFGFNWGNLTGTLRWNHTFTDSLFMNMSLIHGGYSYQLGVPQGENEFTWDSKIENINYHTDFEWTASPKSTLTFGVQVNSYFFNPADARPGPLNNQFEGFRLDKERAIEPNLYLAHEYKMNDKVSFEYGLRHSSFHKLGQEDVFIYADGVPKDESTIIDTVSYTTNEIVQSYQGFEPRFGVKVSVDSSSSVKFSYNRMYQYVHLISNTTSAVPFDVWRPSGTHIKPAYADQVALGYFRNFEDNTYETSAEIYYKWMNDIVDYKDGAELLFNRTLEADLLTGQGRAYGLELMVRKKKGKLTGWFSYTLSKTERLVEGEVREERINNGEWYPANYDKRNDLTVVLAYELSKRWSVSANFTFSQGRPITLADGKAVYNGLVYPTYTDRNNGRIPNYHRLDFGATLQGKNNDKHRWKSSWVFSVYNVYARRNAFSVYPKIEDRTTNEIANYQLSILGSFVPAATYNFEF